MGRAIHVHFVCRGNTYRSRLAAAYFHSIAPKNFIVSSSGIEPTNADKTVNFYTAQVAQAHGLTYQMDTQRQVTTPDMLSAADIVVCLQKDIYDYAVLHLGLRPQKSIIWHVLDMEPYARRAGLSLASHAHKSRIAERTFEQIKHLCDELNQSLRLNWVDVIDRSCASTGLRLPVGMVNDRGYWHRGVHVLVLTHEGHVVLEKRSNTIVFSPGMIDMTLGGSVDSGEQPLQAIARETAEELGVHVPLHAFHFLWAQRWSSFHPQYGKHSKVFKYAYVCILPENVAKLTPQQSEVSVLKTVPRRTMRRVLRRRYLRHYGRLDYPTKYYKRLFKEGVAVYDARLRAGKKRAKQVK